MVLPALGGEKGIRCRERSQIRSCPRNCKRRALASATGKSGKARAALTREPGDLPSNLVLWRRLGGVHRAGLERRATHRRDIRQSSRGLSNRPGQERRMNDPIELSNVETSSDAADARVVISICT